MAIENHTNSRRSDSAGLAGFIAIAVTKRSKYNTILWRASASVGTSDIPGTRRVVDSPRSNPEISFSRSE